MVEEKLSQSPVTALTVDRIVSILRADRRTAAVVEQSNLLLAAIAMELERRAGVLDKDVGSRPSSLKEGDAKHVQFFNRAYFKLIRGLRATDTKNRYDLSLTVLILSGRIWWGIYAWASAGYVKLLESILRDLEVIHPDEDVHTGTGDFPSTRFHGGAHFAMGKELTATEIEMLPSPQALVERIADDLSILHQRFVSAVDDIQAVWSQRVSLEETIDSPTHTYGEPFQASISASFARAHLAAQGLSFTLHQIATFATALQTKGFVILSGISGTGKTRLAQHFAALMPQIATQGFAPERDLIDDRTIIFRTVPSTNAGYLQLPKAAWDIVALESGESVDISVSFDSYTEPARLKLQPYHRRGVPDHVLRLYLSGNIRQAIPNLPVGTELHLLPDFDEAGSVTSIKILHQAQQEKAPTYYVPNNLFVPIRPDWRDSKSLLGYYNPLTETFESTPFLRFLLRARAHYDELGRAALPHFVLLDEMNLARVEYYFADFLSVLESGRDDDGYTREAVVLHSFRQAVEDAEGRLVPPSLRLPPNLYVVGTVNVDETTHAFSPKVLDRAFTLEFTEVNLHDYPPAPGAAATLNDETRRALAGAFTRQGGFAIVDKNRVADFVADHPVYRDHLAALNERLKPYDLHFAYRVFDEIMAFLDNVEAAPWADGFAGLDDAFDTAVLMKVLPKFHGSRGRLLEPLRAVLAWARQSADIEPIETAEACLKLRQALDEQLAGSRSEEAAAFVYPRTAHKVVRMLGRLHDTGFASFD
jgi:hypothetical protein